MGTITKPSHLTTKSKKKGVLHTTKKTDTKLISGTENENVAKTDDATRNIQCNNDNEA